MKLLLAILLAASSVASVTPSEDFLLTKAATDFHKTSPNKIIHVRHVRFGQVINPENGKHDFSSWQAMDLLCHDEKSLSKPRCR